MVEAQSTTTSTTCLPTAVAESLRKDVVVDGVSMPLGMYQLGWQSASMNYNIFRLLAAEVLGYNVVTTGVSSTHYKAGLWDIVGCQEWVYDEAFLDTKCDLSLPLVAKTHLLFETWDFWLGSTLAYFKSEKYLSRAPVQLGGETGDLGWDGTAANWLPQAVLEAGLRDGIALNIYSSYNASMFNPGKYFTSLEEINTTDFYDSAFRCSDYYPMNDDFAAGQYGRHFPEDTDGVESYLDSEGVTRVRARCEDGVWWLSPACRANLSSCIPWIGYEGFGYDLIWHKAVYYNMPIALASSPYSYNIIHNFNVLNYAWSPDASYVNKALTPLLFPVNDVELDDDYLYVTQFRAVKASKWAHRALEKNASRIWQAATRMNLTKSMLNSLLEYTALNGLTSEEGACHFLQTRQDWWQGWVTPNTNCQEGMGLYINDNGDFDCEWCPRATASVEGTVEGSGASTRYCETCEVGRYQEYSQSSDCHRCAPGTYTDEIGSEVCSSCKQGFYQPEEGSTMCVECPAGRTTTVRGAQSLEECVCLEGTYEPVGSNCVSESDSCACTTCMEGLDCPVGSRLEAWFNKVQFATPVPDEQSVPQVSFGYYSLPSDPTSIFACEEAEACPGGDPGRCSGGRIALTCTRCPDHYFLTQGGACKACEGWEPGLAIVCTLLGAAGLTIAHVAVNWPASTSSQWTMTTVFLLGMGVTTCLTFTIYANLDLDAIPPLTDLFAVLKILAFDMQVLRASCLTGNDGQMVRYVAKLVAVPASFLALCLGAALVAVFPSCRTRAAFTVSGLQNSMGMIFTIFFIAVSLMSLEAFRCDKHPNGKTSLTSDRSVLCWDSTDHSQLVALSVLAILLYPLPFLTCTALMTYNYSAWTRRCGASFILRSRFLFNRMGPESVAFAFWYNVRNFAMTLVPVVAAEEYALQVNLLLFLFLAWLLAQMYAWPWRFFSLNAFDALTSAVQILMLNNFAMMSSIGHSTSEDPNETAGWTIIALFVFIMTSIVVFALSRALRRVSRRKDYGVFLSHHKETSGRFARQLKLMLTSVTSKKVFLDVDELSNLDNLNFTVRSNTEQVVVLMTEEALTRLWIAVEVASAVFNEIPVHLVAATVHFDSGNYFNEDWLKQVPSMFAPLDVAEFHKVGLEMSHVESAYRFLSTLPILPLHMDECLSKQWSQMETLNAHLSLPVKRKDWVLDPEQSVFLCYDVQSCSHSCAARILSMLFNRRHWMTTLMEDLPSDEDCRFEVSVAVAFLGKTLLESAQSVGVLTALHAGSVPIITVLSGEAFWKPEPGYFDAIRKGLVFDEQQEMVLHSFLQRRPLDSVANGLESLFKILAWRFNPEESESLVLTEFTRIWERAELERLKLSGAIKTSTSEISFCSHPSVGGATPGSSPVNAGQGAADFYIGDPARDRTVLHPQMSSI